MRKQLGRAGFPGGFRPDDYASFAAALDEVVALADADLRQAKAMMRRRFRWEDVARRTVEAYRVANLAAPTGVRGHGQGRYR